MDTKYGSQEPKEDFSGKTNSHVNEWAALQNTSEQNGNDSSRVPQYSHNRTVLYGVSQLPI